MAIQRVKVMVSMPKELDERIRAYIKSEYGEDARVLSLIYRQALIEYLDRRDGNNRER